MRNSFTVQFAVHLWLTSIGLTGVLGSFVGFFATVFLGSLLDRGIVKLDIAIDKLKEALKDPQWREAALKAYKAASARVYTEEEKDAIRKQYLDALSHYASFGDGVSKH